MKYEQHNLNTRRLPISFHCDTMRKGDKDFTHWHENIEILCFLEGEGRVVCDFRKEAVQAGDIYVINSEKLHMVETDDMVKYYCLIPGTDFCEQNGLGGSDLRFAAKIRDEAVREKYLLIADCFERQGGFHDTRIRIAVLELLLEIAEHYPANEEEPQEEPEAHLQNVKEAIRYIKIHFQESVTVDDVAKAAGLSKAYLSREFKEITGFTMIGYLNLVRCQYACKLLRTGRYKVNEIAIDAGFENMSYFTRTYKKIMGCLPSKEAESI